MDVVLFNQLKTQVLLGGEVNEGGGAAFTFVVAGLSSCVEIIEDNC